MAILHNNVVPFVGGEYTIDQSLRFEDGSSAYLSRTPASAGNRKTWTWSGWVKLGNLALNEVIFAADTSTTSDCRILIQSNYILSVTQRVGNSTNWILKPLQLFRDPSAYYHIVVAVDTTQSTVSDRVKIFVNGGQVTEFDSASYPALNHETSVNATLLHRLGARGNSSLFFDGYLAEVHFIDGQALTSDYFGEVDETYGHWKPIEYTGTYGTNGFYLDFADGGAIGNDVSGNNNDWTPTNLAATDVVIDTPTNNFATLNAVAEGGGTLSEGNLQYIPASTVGPASLSNASGKFYFEVNTVSVNNNYIGILDPSNINPNAGGNFTSHGAVAYKSNGDQYAKPINGTTVTSSYGAAYAAGDIIGVAVDIDADTITFYKNNVSQGVTTNGPSFISNGPYTCFVYANAGTMVANFGQDSSFAGNKTAQGNTDANGYGDFYYSPPSGFLALCTQNLPDPTVIPSEHFNTVLWTGNGTAGHAITGVGFQPDLVWIKERAGLNVHQITDSVRGPLKGLNSNLTAAENNYDAVRSFSSDGFVLGISAAANQSSNYVAWNWKANNTSGSSNTDGSITSTVAANADAGFSIVSYTGTGAAATVGHGLSSAPEMIIVKSRDDAFSWGVYHKDLSSAAYWLKLQTTVAQALLTTAWNSTAPTSSVFSLGSSGSTNNSGSDLIAYCFHSVDSYSKIGSYTGNGSSDGPFVYTGFRPAFVMVKRTDSAGNWTTYDAERAGYNDDNEQLYPNLSNAEGTSTHLDILSNGFKWRTSDASRNASGGTYIYMAFAEYPFSVGGGIAR